MLLEYFNADVLPGRYLFFTSMEDPNRLIAGAGELVHEAKLKPLTESMSKLARIQFVGHDDNQ